MIGCKNPRTTPNPTKKTNKIMSNLLFFKIYFTK